MQDKKITIIVETVIESILKDTFSIFALVAPLFLNQYFLGGKWYLDVFFMFFLLSLVANKFNNSLKRFTKDEAKKYINNL